MMYELRWRFASCLIGMAFWVAPRGAARDLLIGAIRASNDEILRKVAEKVERAEG